VSVPGFSEQLLTCEDIPDAVQCISNPLNSSGSMAITREETNHRSIINTAVGSNVGVMGIRAVAAGALTDNFDRAVHPKSAEHRDYQLAAPFRSSAEKLGITISALAYRYALQMPGLDAMVLGVKSIAELQEALNAESERHWMIQSLRKLTWR
jgi:aryl-alcohol dehydrogenase-like predicted oxidoreductase